MKFIDETNIKVLAGKGGDGCLSFRREKYIQFGGPNGGDGGDGGSIFLKADPSLNTLVNFKNKHIFKSEAGESGRGSNCTGKSGDDLYISVPLGTAIHDKSTNELLGDLTKPGEIIKVAQGGIHGLGNARFKSSTNRSPRKITPGTLGEQRDLYLELKLLADIGLVGLPNAGKSTFIRAVSSAHPKVADYPFTTLRPNLGVVRVDDDNSFVIADIPGIISGAADGAGLGIQFLKHISRTKLLLHLVDIAPADGSDPLKNIQEIIKELEKFSSDVASKPRWLVFNKIDLLSKSDLQTECDRILKSLKWSGPYFKISAIQKLNTQDLIFKLAKNIEDGSRGQAAG